MNVLLPFKAYSVNDYFYNDRKHGKRKEAREWEHKVNWELQKYDFSELRNSFDAKKHALKVTITFYYSNFFTKSGKLNSKIYDLSNCEKPLLDLLLNPVNFGPAPFMSPNLNIDDCKVVELLCYKRPGNDSVAIKIEVVDIPS